MSKPVVEPAVHDLILKRARHLERENNPREAMLTLAPLLSLADNEALAPAGAIELFDIAVECAFVRADYALGVSHVAKLARVAEAADDDAGRALADFHRSRILYQQGNYSAARRLSAQSGTRALAAGLRGLAARARLVESYTACSQLEHNKARDLVAEAIELAEQCSDDVVLAFVLHGAGQHRFIAARESASADKASAGANEALALFERALPVAIASEANNLSRVIEFNRMRTWMLLGRAVECVAPLQAMLRDCQVRGLTHVEFAVRATLASALRTIGNPREALRLTTAGLALARRHGCVNQAVQYLRRERDLAFDALGQTRQDTEPAFLARADAYIEANLESPSLVAMAAHCGVSTRTLHLAFRRHRGLSPISVARNARLEMAANALAEGGQSVKDIARRFGFGSVTTFANEFKRRFGMTPRQRLREQSR